MIPRLLAVGLLVAGVAASGEFERRFELTLERVLAGGPPAYTPPLLLADLEPRPVRRFTEFSGDLSGRYLGALSAVAAFRPQALDPARSLEPSILKLQRPDGHFGDPLSSSGARDDDMARLWGQGRLLVGLLEYHDATGDPAALDAARRLGDFLVSVGPRFNASEVRSTFSADKLAHGYICWTQNLEGLALLYAATSDQRYADLARQLADRIERLPNQHSHGLLTCLRGLVELAGATGEKRYLEQAAREWASLAASKNLLPTASIPEYFAPGIRRDEGCSEADWVRLSLELWRLTGEPKYLEMGERALFNAFYMNQMSSGDFGHVSFTPAGLDFGETRAWWCCTLHGLRAFAAISAYVFRADADGLTYELPIDGEGEGGGLRVKADSTLERDGRVTLEVRAAPAQGRTLRIRRPDWAAQMLVDGAAAEGDRELTRVWRPGERVEIEYRSAVRSESGADGGTFYFYGPWLLGVSEASSPAYFDEPYEHNRLNGAPAADPDGYARLEAPFTPAGYSGQPQTAVLLPLAQRGFSGAGLRWVFAFDSEAGTPALSDVASRTRRWASPFLVGLLLGGAGVWLIRRRRAA